MNGRTRPQGPGAETATTLSESNISRHTDNSRVATLEALSQLLRDEGIARANAAADHWWASCFDTAVGYFASTGVPFTADDVRELIPAPDHPNRTGARFHAANRAGLIRPTGFALSRSRSRHAGVLRVWQGIA